MCRWSWLAVGAFVQMTTAVYAQNGQRPPDPPWQQTDVGDVGIAGSATVGSDADLFINGAGSDIWGTTDSFHFVYQTMYDGEIGTSAGPSLQNTHPHAKIGLMIRLTVAADSPHVVLDLQPDGSVEFMQRATAGVETTFIGGVAGGVSPGWNLRLLRSNGRITAFACARMCRTVGTAAFPNGPALVGAVITSAATTFVAGTARSFPVQLQLERSGSTFTAWVVDGTQMTKLGELSVDLPSDTLIGLAVTVTSAARSPRPCFRL